MTVAVALSRDTPEATDDDFAILKSIDEEAEEFAKQIADGVA